MKSDMAAAVQAPEPEGMQVASIAPKPQGYKLLIALPEIDEKTEGGVYKPDALRDREKVAAVVGFVVAMGPDAYKNDERFPSGPYCKQGDWIIMQAYTGTRVKVHGNEFRLINDDQVSAVVEDPRGIERV